MPERIRHSPPSESADLVPVRMCNELVYCERLFYLEHVQGYFVDSSDTVHGRSQHERAATKGRTTTVTPPTAEPDPDDPTLSELLEAPRRCVTLESASLGVRVGWVYSGAFAFGVALAGLAGVLLAPIYSVFPTMGRDFILLAFTVVIVGGMGSIWGAVVAGLALTQIQAIASLIVSPVWADPIVFGVMVLVLMFRPQGLFGRIGHA